jgi:hypothetical protein
MAMAQISRGLIESFSDVRLLLVGGDWNMAFMTFHINWDHPN